MKHPNEKTILDRWQVTSEELTSVIDQNPSLRGMILGYLAEFKLEKIWFTGKEIEDCTKHDDHNRKKKGDRVIRYKGHEFIFESKSLQTNTILKTEQGWTGKAQVDASDRRLVQLPDGTTLNTTCLLKGEFDILAVNVFAFEESWRFLFARNSDLPSSRFKKYSDSQREYLLATLITVEWPPQPPFRDEPFTLMNEIIQERI